MTNKLKIIICAFSILGLSSTSCRSDYPTNASAEGGSGTTKVSVKTTTAEETAVEQTVSATGTLAAQDQATIGAKVTGRVTSISVDLGSDVKRGQVIAQIDEQDYKLRVEQAAAALEQSRAVLGLDPKGKGIKVDPEQTSTVRRERARADEAKASLDRASRLIEQGVVSRSEYDSFESAYKVALNTYRDAIEEIRNRVAQLSERTSAREIAQQQLLDTTIYAPFDGKVEQKIAGIGEYLAASAPIVRIVKVNPLRLRVEVSERSSQNVAAGQKIRVSVDGVSGQYTGTIVRLSPIITDNNRVLVVEAEVPNDGQLRPGAFARIEIIINGQGKAITVPQTALATYAGIEKLILVQNGRAVEKPVTTGRKIGERVEIVDGITAGETVILSPGNIQNGQAVIVQ
ncbi:MAG: efflux RND transporter periplasmic adaptor subunit [Pyrinomonadaceae bacterium]